MPFFVLLPWFVAWTLVVAAAGIVMLLVPRWRARAHLAVAAGLGSAVGFLFGGFAIALWLWVARDFPAADRLTTHWVPLGLGVLGILGGAWLGVRKVPALAATREDAG